MDISLKIAPKKDLNLIAMKMKRRKLKSKKLHSRVFASFAKKFLEIRSRKFKLDKDLVNHHVPLSLENTDGLLIWRES